jgi:hypothetical protein
MSEASNSSKQLTGGYLCHMLLHLCALQGLSEGAGQAVGADVCRCRRCATAAVPAIADHQSAHALQNKWSFGPHMQALCTRPCFSGAAEQQQSRQDTGDNDAAYLLSKRHGVRPRLRVSGGDREVAPSI